MQLRASASHPVHFCAQKNRQRSIAAALLFIVMLYLWNQPVISKIAPLVHVENTKWRVCENEITKGQMQEAKDGIESRIAWGKQVYDWKDCEKNEICRRDSFMVAKTLTNEADIDRSNRVVRIARGGNMPLPSHKNYERFDMIGPVAFACNDLRAFGSPGDEERYMCWRSAFNQPGCTVFSVGSNNQYEFEESAASIAEACAIHTFDCTVDVPIIPEGLKSRVTFHKLCLGDRDFIDSHGRKYTTFTGLVKAAGIQRAPDLLKMDIEGYEWKALLALISSAEKHLIENGEDLFPLQIAIEVHYAFLSWSWDQFGPREILAYFNRIFFQGGYVLAYRRDNFPICYFCTEILLVKTKC
jgi:hypothetical protein